MKVEKQVLGSPMGLHLENLYKKKNLGHTHPHRRACACRRLCEDMEKMTIYKPRREASEETNPVDNLSQTSGLQDCEKINLSFKFSNLWYFVRAALAN